jgi:hypothetical protein
MAMSDEVVARGGSRGRYQAEYVRVAGESPEAELQGVLDAKAGREWHLVGAAGWPKEGGIVLFWDTARPNFGRTSR